MRPRIVLGVLLFLTLLSAGLAGCYEPYQREEYFVIDGPSASFMGESILQYPTCTVEGVVFQAVLTGEREGFYIEHKPYTLLISAWKEKRNASEVCLESISITNSHGFNLSVVSNTAPVTLSFMQHTVALETAIANFNRKLELTPTDGHHVVVTMVVLASRNNRRTYKTLKYEFSPKVSKGWFRFPI